MLKLLLKLVGWTLARTPEPLLHAGAAALGDLIFFGLPRRRRLVLSNLHHAFPDRPASWHRCVGRESCRRLVETGLLSLATPYLSERRLRIIISASPELTAAFDEHRVSPAPTLICSPHLAYWEAQTSMSLVLPDPFPEFGTIFRPLDNAAADAWVRRSRERFGMRLLSRKEGFAEALKILRRRGMVGVLFDQNAGMQGALTTLFGRVCSTTELPGLMAEKFDARVYAIFPRRRRFWRVEISVQRVADHDGTSAGVTLALNRWLELALAADDNFCASWLWAHDRWRHQDMPAKRLRLESRRNLLELDARLRGLRALPRRTRIWVRLPNWLGDVVMAVPLLRALQRSRPDAEITLLARAAFAPLVSAWGIADRVEELPARGRGYFRHFRALRHKYPDAYLLFTNSFRGDLEAWLAGCRQRFGIVRPNRPRPLLTHRFYVPPDFDERSYHQLELWDQFFREFGLTGSLDCEPVDPEPEAAETGPIGFIAGSENTPEKRWPISHWRSLLGSLPDHRVVLFGTERDRAITKEVAAGYPFERVIDLAGRTDLPTFATRLKACRLLVTNDTGGMHLANALGIPIVALFGPTNPIRTAPVFRAPVRILQPDGCEPTGGASLEQLSPETVVGAVRDFLESSRTRN